MAPLCLLSTGRDRGLFAAGVPVTPALLVSAGPDVVILSLEAWDVSRLPPADPVSGVTTSRGTCCLCVHGRGSCLLSLRHRLVGAPSRRPGAGLLPAAPLLAQQSSGLITLLLQRPAWA